MTFGEHLEELRTCLVKAIIWLGVGLAIGLLFANRVVDYVADPLEAAIQEFRANRDLARLGYDPRADDVRPLQRFLANHALIWDVVYEIPDQYQNLTQDMIVDAAGPGDPAVEEGIEGLLDEPGQRVDPRAMAELLRALPDPSSLKPRLQLRESREGLSSLKIEEPFMIWVKAGFIVGAVVSSPMVFYHLWSFVAAGLYAHERQYVYIYLPFSVLLFIAGVSLAFFVVLQYVISFLLDFNNSMNVAVEPRLTHYVNFVLLLPLGFGIAFQLPLVMLFLQRIGLLETEAYISSWRIAVLVIFVLSMILTPADVTSMVALAVPLMFLYFLGILMCKFIPRGRGLGSAAYDPA